MLTLPVSIQGLIAHREVTVPESGNEDFARTVDVVHNPTASDITTTVRVIGNLGSDADTTVFATSDGDTIVETTDQWIGTDDGDPNGGKPAIIHYIHGPGVSLNPTAIGLSGDLGDNIDWTYDVTVPAGETVRLAHYTVTANTQAEAIASANALVTATGFANQADEFLTQDELDSIANFVFNTPPVALPSNVSGNEDTDLTIVLTGSDADGDSLVATIETLPADGRLFQTNDGLTRGAEITATGTLVTDSQRRVIFVPEDDANGNPYAGFSFTVSDGVAESNSATVSIGINAVDDAADDTATTIEDTPVGGDVSTNDTYAGTVTYALNTGASNGTATVNPDGTFSYTPNADFNGTDSFTYDATDVNGDIETQTVTITVNPVDDASDDTATTNEDTAISGDVSLNDTYAGAVSYALNTGPSNGTATVNPDGTFSYTPDPDFNGTDAFTYDAIDVNGDIETQTLTVTVNPVDDANDDTATTDEDTAVSGDVSLNDTNAGAVSYALNTGPSNGTATVNPDGTFSYTPDPDFNGTDAFTYDAIDVNGDIETQTVTITVNPVDDARDDTATTNEDNAVSGDVSLNDTYAGAVNYALNTGPSNGTATVNPDGTFSYTPDPDFNGTDA
ncbi:Ig-like domain-containing protein, partial [Novipirellula rosea]|uniref:Ig-like domain-containing protein n=1 Tax=Novipirellula rosea TaxID=1031540 RepID=UPI0031E8C286